jgi:regulatory protein
MADAGQDRGREACWRQALKLLQRRMHSRRELDTKLRQRGYSREVIAATLAEAERLSLVDDAAFAAAYRDELQRKGLGANRVRAALGRRGVASAASVPGPDEGGATAGDAPDAELARARAAVARRAASLARESDPCKRREKLIRHLLSRGFAMGVIRQAMVQSDGDDEIDGMA